jgi:hypothetical protein
LVQGRESATENAVEGSVRRDGAAEGARGSEVARRNCGEGFRARESGEERGKRPKEILTTRRTFGGG